MSRRKVIGAAVVVVGLVVVAAVVGTRATSPDSETESSASLAEPASPGEDLTGALDEEQRALQGPAGVDGAVGVTGGSGEAVVSGEDPGLSAVPVPEALPGDSRVIKKANLQIEVEEGRFQQRFAQAASVADELGGFVSNSQTVRTGDEVSSGTLTMRVPVQDFEAAVARLKELGEVTGEQRSGQDVTREFVDLEARLRQARTEESFFIRLLDEAESISDLIQIQSQLSSVQLRIEQLQGQLNYLEDRTELSTITARIYEPGADDVFEPVTGLAEARQKAVEGFQTVIAGAIIMTGWALPFLVLGLVVFGAYRMRRRTDSARSHKETEPTE